VPNSGVEGLKKLEYRVKEWDVDFYKYMKDLQRDNKDKPIMLSGDLNVIHHKIDITFPKN